VGCGYAIHESVTASSNRRSRILLHRSRRFLSPSAISNRTLKGCGSEVSSSDVRCPAAGNSKPIYRQMNADNRRFHALSSRPFSLCPLFHRTSVFRPLTSAPDFLITAFRFPTSAFNSPLFLPRILCPPKTLSRLMTSHSGVSSSPIFGRAIKSCPEKRRPRTDLQSL
jgi:hypothetical protein